MPEQLTTRQHHNSGQSPLPLYAGAFFFSGAHGGVFTLALPFIVLVVGGSDKDVGLCFGLATLAYLVSCLTAARHLDRFNPKRSLQLSSACIAITVAAVFFVCRLHLRGRLLMDPIMVITGLNILLSLVLALFWAPMMGWLSIGHEGPSLSRRLGRFNLSWSFALAVSPLLAGYIIQADPNLAVLASALLVGLAFVCVSIAPLPPMQTAAHHPECAESQTINPVIHPDHAAFCRMARSALVTSCMSVSILRTQFALFFTEDLGFTKSQFGLITTLLCFSGFAIFYVTGKTHRWHHRFWPFLLAQVMIAAAFVVILLSKTLWGLGVAVICVGCGQSFIYSSHQYYAVSGRSRRSGSMAVHEVLIATGYGSGAIAGGYLAEYFNRYTPYQFGLAAVLAALVVQAFIFCRCRKN